MNAAQHSARIALGVTGGIAAYKTAELVRLLTAKGHEVFPIMTPWAARFIGPLTLETLTGNDVRIETPTGGEGIEHISLIRSVDLFLLAPLTANTMAKMAHGQADNFLTATYLAHRGMTLVCPAMNTAMLEHPATRRNLETLRNDGLHICMGSAGDLACGETGAGRMAEPSVIADWVEALVGKKIAALQNRKVLISAGPTCEDLDPVRFITNRSSGKMGVAIARAFRNAGADVTLVHGPINAEPPQRINHIPVRTAAEMADAILTRADEMDIVIMAAAVADYRPQKNDQKLKKGAFDGGLQLERTTDILAELGKNKPKVLAGFAAESERVEEHARGKLERKNLDFIFANDISSQTMGFGSDQNRILAISRDGASRDLGTGSKDQLASEIVRIIADAVT